MAEPIESHWSLITTESNDNIEAAEYDDWKPKPHRFMTYFEQNPLNVEEQVRFIVNKEFHGRLLLLDGVEKVEMVTPCVVVSHRYKQYGAQLSRWLEVVYATATKYEQLHFYLEELDASGTFWEYYVYHGDEYNATRSPWLNAIDVDKRRFVVRQFCDAEGLKELAEALLARKLYKSEPLPTSESEKDKLVKKVVADNFDELVLHSEADIVLTVYTPWCYTWRELLPELEEVAAALATGGDNVMVMQLNAALNYVMPRFVTEYYPKTWFLPANSKGTDSDCIMKSAKRLPLHPRRFSNIIEWIAVNSTTELRNYDRQGVRRPTSNEIVEDTFALKSLFSDL